MASSKDSNRRSSLWAFVFYPGDSAPDNWRDILDGEHIPMYISPLHDSDKNPDGSDKKVHRHVLMDFKTLKSYGQAHTIAQLVNGTIPIIVNSKNAMARYFMHWDNPEKAQYLAEDAIALGGFDVAEALKKTASDRYNLIREMMDFVRDNNVTEMFELMDYASREKFDTWFPLLCDNSAIVMQSYVNSLRNYNKDILKKSPKRECSEPIYDANGVRWCKCSSCGVHAPVDAFAVYGGKDANTGICRNCFDEGAE